MSGKKNKLPPPVEATIESLSHDGRGITRVNGKTVFVDNALPGERVRFRYLRRRSKRDEAVAEEILSASPDRIEPFCPHFHVCGGCSLQHMATDSQIRYKNQVLLEQFRHLGRVEPAHMHEPVTGPVRGYRRKARLSVKYVIRKERVLVGFREKHSSFIADIDGCGVLVPAAGELLPALKDLIAGLSIRDRIPQIEVSVGDENTVLVIRHLQPLDETDLENLRAFEEKHAVTLYLQSGGPDSLVPLSEETGKLLYYRFGDGGLSLSFEPLDFIQVNQDMNQVLLDRIREMLETTGNDRVLDLFCGIGNFTLPLSREVDRITGVEGESALVRKAGENARRNNIVNADFHQADLGENGLQASFLRQSYNKILLDPPRSGAREILQRLNYDAVEKIVYVSCNPATLARDAGLLVHEMGFQLTNAGVVDMFPHTAHVESIALFIK